MVLAYALLRAPGFWQDSLLAIERADHVLVPDVFRAEFVNVVWQWVNARQISIEIGRVALWDAEGLLTQVVSSEVLWEHALNLSVARRHSAYDMLFVALAAESEQKLVTYDRQLKRLCPEYVISVAEFLTRR